MKIYLPQWETEREAPRGTRLSEVLYAFLGEMWSTPCGGNGTCGKCAVTWNGKEVLSCQTRLEEDGTVLLPESVVAGGMVQKCLAVLTEFSPELGEADGSDDYGLAVDLGTTTLAAALVRGGQVLGTVSRMNPQARYGQNVISRIGFSLTEPNGARTLQELLLRSIKEMALELCAQAGIAFSEIGRGVFAGNTTMEETLLGLNLESLSGIPFLPSTDFQTETEALFPGMRVRLFPVMGGFVGGDITAGLLAARPGADTLFLDLGTNGEMVLTLDSARLACAAAAGPALEGAEISCGMRAGFGAIESVTFDSAASEFRFHTLGDVPRPVGICGSGLIDLLALLLDGGDLTPDGRLVGGKPWELCEGISLTQADVRQLQLAIGAIRAGIQILLKKGGRRPEDLRMLAVAGGLGRSLNIRNAQRVGLLPVEVPAERIAFLGNTSLCGAILALNREALWRTSFGIAAGTTCFDLSQEPDFTDTFVACMEWK
ncbi:MAG: ASKHA domain-containing protein [Planctomycetia bacterium]|nr:ASKHA domain-containing protein [Planctomycetia bacterium]